MIEEYNFAIYSKLAGIRLDPFTWKCGSQEEPKPALSHENVVINELIREYLEYNHYKHTLSVLIPESGQPLDRVDRAYLAQELNIQEDRTSRHETFAHCSHHVTHRHLLQGCSQL
jgi:hypothetical protein